MYFIREIIYVLRVVGWNLNFLNIYNLYIFHALMLINETDSFWSVVSDRLQNEIHCSDKTFLS